jgi:hypothetical protein
MRGEVPDRGSGVVEEEDAAKGIWLHLVLDAATGGGIS